MRVYPTFFRLAFSWMDAERAHKIGFKAIRLAHSCGAGRLLQKFTAPAASLQTQAFGLTFPSPFGLAAGFDKEGHGIEALTELGFGHVEVGTITGQAQPGNPAPRLFRLVEDRAVINRMGFNNDGAAAVAPRLKSARAALQLHHSGVRPGDRGQHRQEQGGWARGRRVGLPDQRAQPRPGGRLPRGQCQLAQHARPPPAAGRGDPAARC